METKTYVLLSGGIDSSTCLHLAIRDFGRDNCKAYSVDYGQLHGREIESAIKICQHNQVPHIVLRLSPQPPSPLTNKVKNDSIPNQTYSELPQGISPSYHHYRNGQLLSLIAAYASADLQSIKPEDDMEVAHGVGSEQGIIYAGQHAEDAANWAYADCTPEFLGCQATAIYIGTYQKVRLSTPLMWMLKSEIVALGHSLEVPWALTYSCYRGGEKHCGACPTCKARHQAFLDANVPDPTHYADGKGLL